MNLEEISESIREGARRFAAAQPNMEGVAAAAAAFSAAMRMLPPSQEAMERLQRMAAVMEAERRAAEALAAQIEHAFRKVTIYDFPPEFRAPKLKRAHLSNEAWRRNGKRPGSRR